MISLLGGLVLSLAAFCIKEICGITNFTSQPRNVGVQLNQSVSLLCSVSELPTGTSVDWWFVNQNQQLTSGGVLLVEDGRHFNVITSFKANGDFQSTLQISAVRSSDTGLYKCQFVTAGDMFRQINSVNVQGPGVSSSNASISYGNFTDCCIRNSVSSDCQPLCAPKSLQSFTALWSCIDDVPTLLSCGSGQRNNAPCCYKNGVPALCLDLCRNDPSAILDMQILNCAPYVLQIANCFAEGLVTLPTPPTRVTAEANSSSQVFVQWQPPGGAPSGDLRYRAFYQQSADSYYHSTDITGSQFLLLQNLTSDTDYTIGVITINNFGSSQMLYVVTARTWPKPTSQPVEDAFDLLGCCQEHQVAADCQALLCGGNSSVLQPDQDLLHCFSDVDKVFQCLSGMANHTDCCARQRIPSNCYPLCDGRITDVTIDLLYCFDFLNMISTCFNYATANLPGHPRNLVLLSVTSTQAMISWSPPLVNPTMVVNYNVRYRQTSTQYYATIQTSGLNYTLSNLLPSTEYEVSVISVGSQGSSLPSPVVSFRTYWMPGLQPTNSPLPGTTLSPSDSLQACCRSHDVPTICQQFCNYNLNVTNVDLPTALTCSPHLQDVLQCAVDGKNHSLCCARRSVQSKCLGFCDGLYPQTLIMDCISDLSNMLACFNEGISTLPSMPRKLAVANKTTVTISLVWSPPTDNADLVRSYTVFYRLQTKQEWTVAIVLPSATPNYILQNLSPDTVYIVQVMANADQGTSLPTPVASIRTMPEILNLNITIITDVSECCRGVNVSSDCLPVCSGSGVINLHQCYQDLNKIIACSSDLQDHSLCCERMNVPSDCVGFCRGNSSVANLNELICLSYIESIFTCFRDGFAKLPSPPYRFTYIEIGSTDVTFMWSYPVQKFSDGLSYSLFYKNTITEEVDSVPYVSTPFTLNGLLKNTRYQAYLVAMNAFGTSLPTITLTFSTLNDDSSTIHITQEPEGYIAIDQSVELDCSSVHNGAVYWIRPNNTRFEGSSIVIDAASPSDTGIYTCVSSSASHHDSASVVLRIQFVPTAQSLYSQVEINPDQSHVAHISCQFTGYPDTVQWYKGDAEIGLLNDDHYTTATYIKDEVGIIEFSLSINSVGSADLGLYSCAASNDYATETAYVLLTAPGVTATPLPTKIPPEVTNVTACCLSKNVQSQCMSACTFDVDIDAILSNHLQCASDLASFIQCAADGRNHSGCCVGKMVPSNCLPYCSGSVPSATDLTCLSHIADIVGCMESGHANLPSSPQSVAAIIDPDGLPYVTWSDPKVNPQLVSYFQVLFHDMTLNVSSSLITRNHSMVFTNASMYTQYSIAVTANNHHGSSRPSNSFFVFTREFPASEPLLVSATAVDSKSILVSWVKPLVNADKIDLYTVYYQSKNENSPLQVTVVRTVFQTTLTNLSPDTAYDVSVSAQMSSYEGRRSKIVRVRTDAAPSYDNSRSVGLGVGLFFLFFVLIIVIIVVIYLYIRHQRRKKLELDESVFFENPGYSSDSQVKLPDTRQYRHLGDDYSTRPEVVSTDSVTVQEPNDAATAGYSTVSTMSDINSNSSRSPIPGSSSSGSTC